jgi:hypothetical protein
MRPCIHSTKPQLGLEKQDMLLVSAESVIVETELGTCCVLRKVDIENRTHMHLPFRRLKGRSHTCLWMGVFVSIGLFVASTPKKDLPQCQIFDLVYERAFDYKSLGNEVSFFAIVLACITSCLYFCRSYIYIASLDTALEVSYASDYFILSRYMTVA